MLAMELATGMRPVSEHRELLSPLAARRRPRFEMAGAWRCRRVVVQQDPRHALISAVMEEPSGRVAALSVIVSAGRITAMDVLQPERSEGWTGWRRMSTASGSG